PLHTYTTIFRSTCPRVQLSRVPTRENLQTCSEPSNALHRAMHFSERAAPRPNDARSILERNTTPCGAVSGFHSAQLLCSNVPLRTFPPRCPQAIHAFDRIRHALLILLLPLLPPLHAHFMFLG